MLKIRMTDDIELRNIILSKLNKNKEEFGERYCPCKLVKNIDTICMCKEFREQDFAGECHCGLYEKYE